MKSINWNFIYGSIIQIDAVAAGVGSVSVIQLSIEKGKTGL